MELNEAAPNESLKVLQSRRGRFRFSLSTLFVAVAVICIWLGYETKLVRDRMAFRRWIADTRGTEWAQYPETFMSPIRRWLSDWPSGGFSVGIGPAANKQMEEIHRLFSEADRMPIH